MQNRSTSHSAVAGVEVDQTRPASKGPIAALRKAPQETISIVFPAHNEQGNIAYAIESALEIFQHNMRQVEVIVVNDGSTDNTQSILDELCEIHPELRVVQHETNKGYGEALRSGLYAATQELVFFSDSDLQFDLSELQVLLFYIHDHDMVIGYRVDRADPLIRRFNAWAWNMLVRNVLDLDIRDIDCAFKLFRREVFDQIKLESVGAMINTELLSLATQEGMKIKQVPVSHYSRTTGEQSGANLKVIFKAFKELKTMATNLRKNQPVKREA